MTKRLTTKAFIKRAKTTHNNTYNYSCTEYVKSTIKVKVACKKHGIFEQLPFVHLSGCGCSECKKEKIGTQFRQTKENFIKRAIKKHKNKFNYDKVIYKNSDTKIKLFCNQHQLYFECAPYTHLKGKGSCPKCRYESTANKLYLTKKKFIKKATKIHENKYDYSMVDYKNNHTKIKIVCEIHGKFKQNPADHLSGQGCPKCGIIKRDQTKRNDINFFIKKATKIHGNKYDYSNSNYIAAVEKINIICPNHGEFFQLADNHLAGKGCAKCVHQISKGENEITEWIKSLNVKVNTTNTKIIKPQHIDIVLPKYNLGIEYNGLYWHNENKGKGQFYHLNKTEQANKQNMLLLHFWDYEWENKQSIVKSIILNKIEKNKGKYFARKLQMKTIKAPQAREFCDANHLHGFRSGSLYLGLFQNKELVSLMITAKNGEMIRFVNKIYYSVVGGFSKLLKYSNVKYSFVDRRVFDGHGYLQNGFILEKVTKPNYFYTHGGNKIGSRQQFQKHKLKKKLKLFDPNLTEVQNMAKNEFYRVFDCGHLKMRYMK